MVRLENSPSNLLAATAYKAAEQTLRRRQTHTSALNHVLGPALPVLEGWSAWCLAALGSELKTLLLTVSQRAPGSTRVGKSLVLQKWRLPTVPHLSSQGRIMLSS